MSAVWLDIVLLVGAAILIGFIGPRLARTADRVGVVTGLGQTLAGVLLLGATTSLPGIVAAVTTAAQGRADLAVGTAMGGVAAQTLFIAFADAALRGGEIQRASGSRWA